MEEIGICGNSNPQPLTLPTPKIDNSVLLGAILTQFDPADPMMIMVNAILNLRAIVRYPCGCNIERLWTSALINVIIHLNDNHEWTRTQIADWLDTLDLDLRFS